jgi:hypothetical protein
VISLKPVIVWLSNKPVGFDGLWFRRVGGAAEYAMIRPESLPLPAAWVVRNSDKSRPAGEREDNTTLEFDVVIAIENVRKLDDGDTDDLLLKYRKEVYQLLRGWETLPGVRPMNYHGGRVIEYTDGDLYWADRYSFDALINNYLPDPGNFGSLNNTGGSLL